HYQLGLHNTAISTISNLPLNDKSAVQLDISVMGAYSLIRCHYLALNRTFTSRFDWNKSTFPLAWFEEVKLDSNGKVPRETVFARSLESNYRVVIRRNEAKYTPYQMLVDNSVDMTAETVPQKSIGELTCRAGAGDGVLKSLLKTILLADKNATVEMGGRDASQRYKIFLKGFTKTNNVVIGSDSDDGSARLQVTGDIHAKGAVVVTNQSWVKHKYPIDNGGEWRMEFNPNSETDPRFNVMYKMKNGSTRYCSFPKLERSETVAYRSWVDSRIADNFKRGELTTQNLNDVQGYGVYMQGANANATEARNYPTRTAGTLMVLPSAYGVMQKYTNFNTGEEYQRNRNIDGTWRAWRQVDGINKVSKSGDSMNTLTINSGHNVRTKHFSQGAYAEQFNNMAPFFVDESGSVSRDTYHPFVKGKVRRANQYGAAFSLGYTTYQGAQGTDGWGKGVINLIEDNGKERTWTFEHNGNFWSPGDVIAASGKSINGSVQHTDLVGEVAFFARANPPNGWLKANGAAVSRTTYSALFAAIGTTFGAGDGHSTFNLPDLRGEFIRGLDEGRRVDNGRRLG
ncbi:tail fiber protein, partial [Rodentibacter rarus]|uniref:tail fiber protein n=1 Tax=Rodentibacter rarus TaxID=1908260 RepID=UPI00211828C9